MDATKTYAHLNAALAAMAQGPEPKTVQGSTAALRATGLLMLASAEIQALVGYETAGSAVAAQSEADALFAARASTAAADPTEVP